MDLFKKAYNFDTAKKAKEGGYYPYFHELNSKQANVVTMEGKEVIMIGSNNYLGLTSHPDVIKATVDATNKYGTGVSGSRFLNGTLDLHKELEKKLAKFLGKEDATIFSTGYQANLGFISTIAGRNDIIFSDKENHASIYDGIKLSYAEMVRFEHNDMEDLEDKLKKASPNKGKLIVTDGVFSMGGDICNLPELVRLSKKYNARLMVDDAHGLGIMGKTGRGTSEHFGLMDEVDIVMGTFSKSLASSGGYIAGEQHGLIAATSDQSTGIKWAVLTTTSVSTSTIIGSGATNTDNIIAQNGSGDITYAAGLARAYNGGGHNDWYLPSIDELEKLRSAKTLIGGFASNDYWSSSQFSPNQAYKFSFSGTYGASLLLKASTGGRVRAVRSF